MRTIIILMCFALGACATHGPAKFAAPDKNAPVWDLNVGRWQGTNDLAHAPGDAG